MISFVLVGNDPFSTNDGEFRAYVNEPVPFFSVVKNLRNETVSNITIIQEIPEDVEFLEILDGEPVETNTSFSYTNPFNDQTLNISYLKIMNSDSASNFSINVDIDMQTADTLTFGFLVNFTVTGDFFVNTPFVTYYDRWGDANDISGDDDNEPEGFTNTVRITERPNITETYYLPDFETTEPNATWLVVGSFSLAFVALISRALYVKKPIDL